MGVSMGHSLNDGSNLAGLGHRCFMVTEEDTRSAVPTPAGPRVTTADGTREQA